MATMLITHMDCLWHDTGSSHPERPDRLRAVRHALNETDFPDLIRAEAPLASDEEIARAHPADHVAAMFEAMPAEGRRQLDGDTIVSPGSGDAARRAAGAVIAAIDAVFAGAADNAFCAVRPPGHHAEPTQPMGFCLFNNVAVGAHHARAKHGISRVAVIDFDVHHGNGTEAMFRQDGDLFYGSTHQWPLYPGTGERSERGVRNNICNVPLLPDAGSKEFRFGMEESLLPALAAFKPELLIISAGFDAHERDPLAHLNLTDDDYAWITRELMKIADECCAGRVVSVLEGGYDLDALQTASAAHVRELQRQ
ncbi:MAG: histone deacetylase family protein [Minwuia sp.]|uniref:histone deacetylase family protein n=1 Tax=Minwuia sp. TaxID=2493630 RepID=UPI003A880645